MRSRNWVSSTDVAAAAADRTESEEEEEEEDDDDDEEEDEHAGISARSIRVSKYAQMLRMHLPLGAALGRMRQDGCDETEIDAFTRDERPRRRQHAVLRRRRDRDDRRRQDIVKATIERHIEGKRPSSSSSSSSRDCASSLLKLKRLGKRKDKESTRPYQYDFRRFSWSTTRFTECPFTRCYSPPT